MNVHLYREVTDLCLIIPYTMHCRSVLSLYSCKLIPDVRCLLLTHPTDVGPAGVRTLYCKNEKLIKVPET